MRKNTCKYYNGCHPDTKLCEAGINVRSLVGGPDFGWATRMPCSNLFKPNGEKVACEKYTEPTLEEIAAYESDVQAAIDRMMRANAVIREVKKEHKGKDWRGVKECPVCKGRLHMTHAAYNGHVHGKCETEDCLNWME